MLTQGLRVPAMPGGAAGQDPGPHPVDSSPVPQTLIRALAKTGTPGRSFFCALRLLAARPSAS